MTLYLLRGPRALLPRINGPAYAVILSGFRWGTLHSFETRSARPECYQSDVQIWVDRPELWHLYPFVLAATGGGWECEIWTIASAEGKEFNETLIPPEWGVEVRVIREEELR